jgi:hypothetical protein
MFCLTAFKPFLIRTRTSNYFQENRREYEKRVAAIVEQSWMMSFPDESETSMAKSKQNDNATGGATTSGAASR